MIELNNDKIIKYKINLEKEDNLLPILLIRYININTYFSNLKKKNLFNQIQKEMFSRRKKIYSLNNQDLLSFEENELIKWLSNHKEYEDIIL